MASFKNAQKNVKHWAFVAQGGVSGVCSICFGRTLCLPTGPSVSCSQIPYTFLILSSFALIKTEHLEAGKELNSWAGREAHDIWYILISRAKDLGGASRSVISWNTRGASTTDRSASRSIVPIALRELSGHGIGTHQTLLSTESGSSRFL